jgi:serine O-acetyltransferase
MIDFLRSYRERDPSVKSLAEVFFLYPGPKAIAFHRFSHWLYKLEMYFLARLVAEISRWLTGIEIHPGAQIGRRLVIDHGSGVVIGETSIIGDDCMIYHGSTLGGVTWDQGKRHPTLEDGVIIGAGAKVLGPIVLGAGVRVGANSVVLNSVPAGAIAVGIPAKVKVQTTSEDIDSADSV